MAVAEARLDQFRRSAPADMPELAPADFMCAAALVAARPLMNESRSPVVAMRYARILAHTASAMSLADGPEPVATVIRPALLPMIKETWLTFFTSPML